VTDGPQDDRILLGTFPEIVRGNWHFKVSVTNRFSILVLCINQTDPENTFIKFFREREAMTSFIDFLSLHEYYDLDPDI
jgi:hypothetical protein